MELSRREFIKMGTGSLAGLALSNTMDKYVFTKHWGTMTEETFVENANVVSKYYAAFGIDEKLIQIILSEAMSRGGDYCDLYFQHKIRNELQLEDSIINFGATTVDHGVGIRVIKGDQTGYSFSEEITPEAMKHAARTAAVIANSPATPTLAAITFRTCTNYYKTPAPWNRIETKTKVELLENLNNTAYRLDSRIKKCSIRYSDEDNLLLIADSNSSIRGDCGPYAGINISCVAENNGRREKGWAGFSRRCGGEFLSHEEVTGLAKTAVDNTIKLFDSTTISGGEMEVVLGPGDTGVLLHEAIGHGIEADFNRKGTSIFTDKMNTSVAEKFVTIVDDGTCEHHRGSINTDDEGNDSARTVLVHDGILCSYMHDHISFRHYNTTPTGNGRRQSFRFIPTPRMRNTCMLPGPHHPEEIIKSVKYGLYVDQIGNGQVMIGGGDFTFYVVRGNLIENGKLTKIVKDVNLIGNGPDVLKHICMVGNDFQMSTHGGMCGKDGQSVPVSFGMPTVKVSKLTVGAAKG
jgi:TldD protein